MSKDWLFDIEKPGITLLNCDCMELMKTLPDKCIDVAIVDPPYGIKQGGDANHTRSVIAKSKDYHAFDDGQAPDEEYFAELMRVSKNQVIFGANHFIDKIPIPSPCWIVWDKENGKNDFADCELAWTSFNRAVRKFSFRWQGMLQGDMKNKEERIHPTQKPVKLYEWILTTFCQPGDIILDTHAGSGSLEVACHHTGHQVIGCEIDEVYYAKAKDRIDTEMSQIRFDFTGE